MAVRVADREQRNKIFYTKAFRIWSLECNFSTAKKRISSVY